MSNIDPSFNRVPIKSNLVDQRFWRGRDGKSKTFVGMWAFVTSDSNTDNNGLYLLVNNNYHSYSSWFLISKSIPGNFEPALGNPTEDAYILYSNTNGTRYWAAATGHEHTSLNSLVNIDSLTSAHTLNIGYGNNAGNVKTINLGTGGVGLNASTIINIGAGTDTNKSSITNVHGNLIVGSFSGGYFKTEYNTIGTKYSIVSEDQAQVGDGQTKITIDCQDGVNIWTNDGGGEALSNGPMQIINGRMSLPKSTIYRSSFSLGQGATPITASLNNGDMWVTSSGIFARVDGVTKQLDQAVLQNHKLLSTIHEDTTAADVVRGDLVVGRGVTPKWERFAKGTARQALIMDTSANEPIWAASMQSILTTAGDIIYASAANTPARLAKGTARQALIMNADATAPAWGDSMQSILEYAGAMITASAANTPAVVVPPSVDGHILRYNLATTKPEWSSISNTLNTLLTTKGDILYKGTSEVLRLPGGVAGQQLIAGGLPYYDGVLGWVDSMYNILDQAGCLITTQYANEPKKLSPGSPGHMLVVAPSGDNLTWVESTDSIFTTDGDTLYYGSGTINRLGIGSEGQVLTVHKVGASFYPTWADAAAGSMVYPDAGIALSTGTAWGTSISVLDVARGGTGIGSYGGDGYLKAIDTYTLENIPVESVLADIGGATSTHVHGDITNVGAISSAAVTIGSGDRILISDTTNSEKIQRGIAFGTTTTTYLNNSGAFSTPPNTNTTYAEISEAEIDAGTASTLRTISGRRAGYIIGKSAPVVHTHTSFNNEVTINNDIGLKLNGSGTSGTYSGLQILSNNVHKGYLISRQSTDSTIYSANGVTLVADAGHLAIATRNASNKIRFITNGTDRMEIGYDGVASFTTTPLVSGTAVSLVGHSHATTDITSGRFVNDRMPSRIDYRAVTVTGDWDNVIESGWYNGSNLTNSPSGGHSWKYVMVIRHQNSSDYVGQTAYDFTSNRMWVRYKAATWSSWSELITDNVAQTISGVKTFSSNVIVPNATAATHAVNRQTADARFKPVRKQGGTTSAAAPNPTGDGQENEYFLSALATAPTFASPSGAAGWANGNTLMIRIINLGTTRTLGWNSVYASVATLPSSIEASKTMYIGFVYNVTANKWDCVSVISS